MFKTGEAPWLNTSSENDLITPEGIQKTLESKTFLIETAGGYRACAIIRDITKRKKVLDAIRSGEEELKIMHQASMAVLERMSFGDAARRIFDLSKKVTGTTAGYIALSVKTDRKTRCFSWTTEACPVQWIRICRCRYGG